MMKKYYVKSAFFGMIFSALMNENSAQSKINENWADWTNFKKYGGFFRKLYF